MSEALELPGGDVTLEPGERVLWTGEPRLFPRLASFRHLGRPGLLVAGVFIALAGGAVVGVLGRLNPVLAIKVFAPTIYPFAVFVEAVLARRARRYVATDRRAFVSDPLATHWFPLRAGALAVEGRDVVARDVTPAKLGAPLRGIAAAFHAPARASLDDLADPEAALSDLERGVATGVAPGSPGYVPRRRLRLGTYGLLAMVLVFLLLEGKTWFDERARPAPVGVVATSADPRLGLGARAALHGTFTPAQLQSLLRERIASLVTAGAGARHFVYEVELTLTNRSATVLAGEATIDVSGVDPAGLPVTFRTSVAVALDPGEESFPRVLVASTAPLGSLGACLAQAKLVVR